MGETERGDAAPRVQVTYWCSNGHENSPSFSAGGEFEPPEIWDCPRCGLPGGQNRDAPPPVPTHQPYKTHLAYVKERRSDADGIAILDEALESLHARRGR